LRLSRLAFRIVVPLALFVTFLLVPASSWAISLQQEKEIGRSLDQEYLKKYSLTKDEAIAKDINDLGQRLAQFVDRKEIEYTFRIIVDDQLNAFSIPAGYIYFTDRLWNTFREDERVGVLAHEIVHSDKRHALDAILKHNRRRLWTDVVLILLNASQSWFNLADAVNTMHELKYSRGDERQADEAGVQLCVKAGMNPAGLLLAMRKIRRFEDEAGGTPPKIFSSHPPTDERLRYLEEMMRDLGVAIPPEDIEEVPYPDKIGSVARVSGSTVGFVSSRTLRQGDVVWVMRPGWDYRYEKRTSVPSARCVVKTVGDTYTATATSVNPAVKAPYPLGSAIHAPAPPSRPTGFAAFTAGERGSVLAPANATNHFKPFDRFAAHTQVWSRLENVPIYDRAGYVVITQTDPDVRYTTWTAPQYAYAPPEEGSVLIPVSDADQGRWIGPVISIGRVSGSVEVMPSQPMNQYKTYEIVVPPVNAEETYQSRVCATARFAPEKNKMVLKITSFNQNWNISRIQTGMDIYESAPREAVESSAEGGTPEAK